MTVEAQNRPASVDEWLSLLHGQGAAASPDTGPTVAVMPGHGPQSPANVRTAPAVVTNGDNNRKIWLILGLVAIALMVAGLVGVARVFLNRQSSEPAPVAKEDRTSAPADPDARTSPAPILTPTPAPIPPRRETPPPAAETPTPFSPTPTPTPTPFSPTPTPTPFSPTPAPTPSPEAAQPTPTEKLVDKQLPPDRSAPSEQPATSYQKTPTIPGFAVGTPESQIISALGNPTDSQARGYWPNTRTALYELLPNRVTLGYIYDRDSSKLVQTEGSFAPTVDDLVVRTALNGMVGGADREILQGYRDVQQRRSNRFTFRKGSLEGTIERNERDRIYIGVWDENLH